MYDSSLLTASGSRRAVAPGFLLATLLGARLFRGSCASVGVAEGPGLALPSDLTPHVRARSGPALAARSAARGRARAPAAPPSPPKARCPWPAPRAPGRGCPPVLRGRG